MTQPMQSPAPQTWVVGRFGRAAVAVAAGVALVAMSPALLWNPVALGVGLVGAVVSLRLWQRLRRVQSTADAPLAALLSLSEAHDGASPGHAHRVALVAKALAESSGCGRPEVERIARAAGLHDIGAIAAGPGPVTSPAPLTFGQEREAARHAVVGAEVLGASAGARELALSVRHHHERWDGAGHPDGLAGEEIPLGARIVAVSDAAVALRSDRAGGDALEIEGHGGAPGPSRRAGPVVRDSSPWTGHPTLVGEPSHPSAAPPTPIGAAVAVAKREVVAHD